MNIDPVLVGRAVSNLIRNALQVGSGSVVVRAACSDVLSIEVEDSGPGFSEPVRPTALEPFVAGRHDGTGLGLAIVSAVARAHRRFGVHRSLGSGRQRRETSAAAHLSSSKLVVRFGRRKFPSDPAEIFTE